MDTEAFLSSCPSICIVMFKTIGVWLVGWFGWLVGMVLTSLTAIGLFTMADSSAPLDSSSAPLD